MKSYVLVLLSLLCAIPAFGQSTTVSGTITDLGGQAWNYGSYTLTFRPSNSNPQGPYFWNGAPFSINQTIQGNLSNVAAFSVSVPSNTSITPSGSTWTVQFCPAATASCYITNITITGTTQNLSGLNPPAISVNLANPPAGAAAYLDSEIVGAKPGSFYFNLNDGTQHFCTLASFPACTWASQPNSASIINGQCVTGGPGGVMQASGFPCGTVQLIGKSTAINLVNASTTSLQLFPAVCSPCFAGGALNTLGKTIELEFMGNAVLQAATGTNITVGMFFNGSSTAITSGTVTPTGSSTLFDFDFRVNCVTSTIGASGQLLCNAWGNVFDLNGVNYPIAALAFPVGAIDLTSGISVGGAIQFSTSSTSNHGTSNFFIIRQDN